MIKLFLLVFGILLFYAFALSMRTLVGKENALEAEHCSSETGSEACAMCSMNETCNLEREHT